MWVPTEQDAEEIRNLAKERRDRAEALQGLTEEVSSVTPDTARTYRTGDRRAWLGRLLTIHLAPRPRLDDKTRRRR